MFNIIIHLRLLFSHSCGCQNKKKLDNSRITTSTSRVHDVSYDCQKKPGILIQICAETLHFQTFSLKPKIHYFYDFVIITITLQSVRKSTVWQENTIIFPKLLQSNTINNVRTLKGLHTFIF